jgi:hypothetical protein
MLYFIQIHINTPNFAYYNIFKLKHRYENSTTVIMSKLNLDATKLLFKQII